MSSEFEHSRPPTGDIKKPRVLVVSHDAGGAEVLSAWCEQHADRYRLEHCLDGPARRIFARDFDKLDVADLTALESFGPDDFVLTGSSLDSDWERTAIARARQQGIRCVTFLEHWDLYRERFDCSNGLEKGLPDEVWVGDEYALPYARRQGFPAKKLMLVPNPYFQKVRRAARLSDKSNATGQRCVLYVCEPISRKLSATYGVDASHYDDETDLMRRFLESAERFGDRTDRVTLRLHPSESPEKYEPLVAAFAERVPVSFSQAPSLVDDIARHDVIVGVESMALVIGHVLGKERVFSCITGRRWPISLPHREIQRVATFDAVFDSIPVR